MSLFLYLLLCFYLPGGSSPGGFRLRFPMSPGPRLTGFGFSLGLMLEIVGFSRTFWGVAWSPVDQNAVGMELSFL
jgi:hypothetical protein